MNITRLSPTTFAVEAQSLSCTRPGCEYRTYAKKHSIGDPCPQCMKRAAKEPVPRSPLGILEKSTYHCDITSYSANGRCDCAEFRCKIEPWLKVLNHMPIKRCAEPPRCKHMEAARKFAKEDANFDELLALLPNQEEQT